MAPGVFTNGEGNVNMDRLTIRGPDKSFVKTEKAGRLEEPPCKIGDTAWVIRNFRGVKHPQRGFVSEMYYIDGMVLHIVVKHVGRGEWGKKVFPTREAAEAAILK